MDSIFQIKINENKLQKILNNLAKEQLEVRQQFKNALQEIRSIQQNQNICKKQFQDKIDLVLSKLTNAEDTIWQRHSQSFKQVKMNIAQTAQSVYLKHLQFQQTIIANSKELTLKNNQMEQKIVKVNDVISALHNKQDETQQIKQKLQKMQKTLNKTFEVTQILQNKNFLYFLQMLIDRQSVPMANRMSQTFKQLRNPFIHEPNEQKYKRLKEIKQIIQQTQGKLQAMQSEYTGYFNCANEVSKQNREATHMHYALLSTKIKQLENKLSQQQINSIQAQCVEKILYPTQYKEKLDKIKTKNQDFGVSSTNGAKNKQEISSMVQLQIQGVKKAVQLSIGDVIKKIQRIEDEIWAFNSKTQSIKSTINSVKNQFDKAAQKWKINSHYIQFSSQKDQLNPKTIGQFLHQFRNIQDNLQQKLRDKLEVNGFKKWSQQIIQKLKIANEQIQTKANKDETRRAFGFIEEKIKQIVTIIADMQNSTRKTAARKMMMQCLSCDDNFFDEQNHNPLSENNNGSSSRAITPRMGAHLSLKKDKQKGRHQYRKSNIEP